MKVGGKRASYRRNLQLVWRVLCILGGWSRVVLLHSSELKLSEGLRDEPLHHSFL